MQKIYRNGTIGALLDLYEGVIAEMLLTLRNIDEHAFENIADMKTNDPDCRSIETVINHVVRSGYGYANMFRRHFGLAFIERKEHYGLRNAQESTAALNAMFQYTAESFTVITDEVFNQPATQLIQTTWGQSFDPDQLFEHAILHIMRHRRQIERFLQF